MMTMKKSGVPENGRAIPASRLAWVFMIAMPAFVLGAAVMFAALWLGPVAVRDKVIAEYEADVMRLARELDAYKEPDR